MSQYFIASREKIINDKNGICYWDIDGKLIYLKDTIGMEIHKLDMLMESMDKHLVKEKRVVLSNKQMHPYSYEFDPLYNTLWIMNDLGHLIYIDSHCKHQIEHVTRSFAEKYYANYKVALTCKLVTFNDVISATTETSIVSDFNMIEVDLMLLGCDEVLVDDSIKRAMSRLIDDICISDTISVGESVWVELPVPSDVVVVTKNDVRIVKMR